LARRTERVLDRAAAVLAAAGGRVPTAALRECVTGEGPSLTESAFRSLLEADPRFRLHGTEAVSLEDPGAASGSSPGAGGLDLDTSIEQLNLCNRAKNQLPRNGVRTVGELLALSEEDILQLANIGRKTTDDILRERKELAAALGDRGRVEPAKRTRMGDQEGRERGRPLAPDLTSDPTPLAELLLSFRPENVLRKQGIRTVGQLASLTEGRLLELRNLGDSSLREICRRLSAFLEHRRAVEAGRVPERPEFRAAEEEWAFAAASLSPRDRRIVEERFGLHGGDRPTLNQVSHNVGVTRERVRQIASNGAALVGRMPLMTPILLEEELEARGGLAFLDDLAAAVKEKMSFSRLDPAGYCELVLTGSLARFRRVPGTRVRGLWALERLGEVELERGLEVAEELVTGGALLNAKELAEVVHRSFFPDLPGLTTAALATPIEKLLPHAARSGDGRLYDQRWGAEERCAAVLRITREPRHFSEVSRVASELFPDRPVSARRALACMVDSDLFCRVGDGVYSLGELGDRHVGHVGDLIVRVLAEADRPLHREEILERVGRISPYQPGTITSGLYCGREGIRPLDLSVFALDGAKYDPVPIALLDRIAAMLPRDGSPVLVRSLFLELTRHATAGEVKSALARIPGIAVRGCGGSMSVCFADGGKALEREIAARKRRRADSGRMSSGEPPVNG